MAAYAQTSMHGDPGLRLRVAWHQPRLDAELAAGASPQCSGEHALRAAQLVEPRRRARLARCLRQAVADVGKPAGAGVPICRAAVLEAAPAMLALADDIVEIHDPSPRGVALTVGLLGDGGGPLYRPWVPHDLVAAAEEARHAL